MATQQQQATKTACMSQFDIMMKMASDREGIAKVFDPAPKRVSQLSHNQLFEQVEVRALDTEASQRVSSV